MGIILQGRHTLDTPQKNKNLHRTLVENMQQGNVGIVKKDVEKELGRIRPQMPVVHVVQSNVKERKADTPLILVDFFLSTPNDKKAT